MTYKIVGGSALFLLGITYFGVAVPGVLLGVLLAVAGVALLAGI